MLEKEAAARSLVLNTTIEMDSYVNIKELVEQGLGYSILPFNSIALDVERRRTSAMRIVDPMITRSVYIAHPIGRPMSHAAGAIEELCRATLANLVTIGKWKGSRLPEPDRRSGPAPCQFTGTTRAESLAILSEKL